MERGRLNNNQRIDVAPGLGGINEESGASIIQGSALQLNNGLEGATNRINRPLYLNNQILSASIDRAALPRPGVPDLPMANIIRLMRRVLPPHAKISEDSKATAQECVSEFITFVTREANEKCKAERRRTVTAEDILWAFSILGFENYIGPLSLYLKKYRESEAAALGGGGSCFDRRVGSSSGGLEVMPQTQADLRPSVSPINAGGGGLVVGIGGSSMARMNGAAGTTSNAGTSLGFGDRAAGSGTGIGSYTDNNNTSYNNAAAGTGLGFGDGGSTAGPSFGFGDGAANCVKTGLLSDFIVGMGVNFGAAGAASGNGPTYTYAGNRHVGTAGGGRSGIGSADDVGSTAAASGTELGPPSSSQEFMSGYCYDRYGQFRRF